MFDAIPRIVLRALSTAYQAKSNESANSLQKVWGVPDSIGSPIEQTHKYPAGS